MIRLRRDRSRTPSRFTGDRLVELSRKLVTSQREVKRGNRDKVKFDSGYWGKAKAQLLKETHEKCAYCETQVAVVDYGDVEHYRPKSKYWWLAYCLDNYLVSCAICNQKFKSNTFPYAGDKLRAPRISANTSQGRLDALARTLVPEPTRPDQVAAYRRAHLAEMPDLVDPYLEEPAHVFSWKADAVAQEVMLVPADDHADTKRRASAAEVIYGLNRQQLLRLRYTTFEGYYVVKMTLSDPGIAQQTRQLNQALLERMLTDEFSYSAMIRFFEGAGDVEDWIRKGLLVV